MSPRKKVTTAEVLTTLPLVEPKKTVKETSQISNMEKLKMQVSQEINVLFENLIKEINTVEEIKKKTLEDIELQKRQRKQEEEEQNKQPRGFVRLM